MKNMFDAYERRVKSGRTLFRDSYGLRTWTWVSLAILGVFLAFVILAGIGHVVMKKGCTNGGRVIGRQVHYDFWSGCFIRDDSGEFVPEDNWFRNEEVK